MIVVISQSGYKDFRKNPELYRIAHRKRIVPDVTPCYFDRGKVMHKCLEASFTGEVLNDETWTEAGVSDGSIIRRGMELARLALETPDVHEVVAVEFEWAYNIPDTDYWMVGKGDRLLRNRESGCYLYGEWKAMTPSKYYGTPARKKKEWQTDVQADFNLIGVGTLGYKPLEWTCEIRYVEDRELTQQERDYPSDRDPRVWEPIEVKRTTSDLTKVIWSVKAVCRMIEATVEKFGDDEPWPHFPENEPFPCIRERNGCPYEQLCQVRSSEWNLEGFKEKEGGLDIVQKILGANSPNDGVSVDAPHDDGVGGLRVVK